MPCPEGEAFSWWCASDDSYAEGTSHTASVEVSRLDGEWEVYFERYADPDADEPSAEILEFRPTLEAAWNAVRAAVVAVTKEESDG
jgi:hypothetical protein